MARYEQLQVRKDALYLAGAPVTIEAEALLQDNKTKTLSAQVKFANVGHLSIDAVVAEYSPVAAMGRELEPVVYQYRCDGAAPGSEFGQTEPVKLPSETVEFSSRVLRIGFTNGEIWDAPEDSEWTKLPDQELLTEAISDKRLLDQYAISVGEGLTYVARELGSGSWACGCGAINGPGRTTCLSCHSSLESQLSHLDKDLLDKEATKREEEEREEAERQAKLAAERVAREAEEAERKRIEDERLAAEKEAQSKKAKKAFAIACVIAALAAVAFVVYNSVVVPSQKYDAAVALADEGEYAQAIEEFTSLGDYKDSQAKIKECQYGEAVSAMESGDYASAKKAFEELGDYEDSQAKLKECQSALDEEAKAAEEAAEEASKREALHDLQLYGDASKREDKAAWYLSEHLDEYETLSQAEVEALFPGTYGWMTIDYYADALAASAGTPWVRTFDADGTYNDIAHKNAGTDTYKRVDSNQANYEVQDGKLVTHSPNNNERVAIYEVRKVLDGFYVFVRRGGNESQVSKDGQLAGAMYTIDVDKLQMTDK